MILPPPTWWAAWWLWTYNPANQALFRSPGTAHMRKLWAAVFRALPTHCWSSVLPAPIRARCKAPLLLVGWPDPGSCVNCQSNTFITWFLFHRGKISALWCWFLCLHGFSFFILFLSYCSTQLQESRSVSALQEDDGANPTNVLTARVREGALKTHVLYPCIAPGT